MSVTRKYVQRPPTFEAVQVTTENAEDVAEWCGGVLDYVPSPNGDVPVIEYTRPHPYKRNRMEKHWVHGGEYLVRNPLGDLMDMDTLSFREAFDEAG